MTTHTLLPVSGGIFWILAMQKSQPCKYYMESHNIHLYAINSTSFYLREQSFDAISSEEEKIRMY